MKFKLLRTYESNATLGELYAEDGSLFCYTIERAKDDPIHPAILEGVYTCTRYKSPKHGEVWKLEDRDGRTFIEIHVTASVDYVRPSFLEGCIGLGLSRGTTHGELAVFDSHAAFDEFMATTENEETIELTITS